MKARIIVGGVVLSPDEARALRRIVSGETKHLRLRLSMAERLERLLQADEGEADAPAGVDGKLRAL